MDAPAGWGTSTLLAEWHASAEEPRPFAWLALDGDNDPATFWTYFIEALGTQHPATGTRSLAPLLAPRAGIINDVLPMLSAGLVTLPDQIVLVLDDYHLVTNPEVDVSLAFFVEHLPRTSLSSSPPARSRRFRSPACAARGELTEIASVIANSHPARDRQRALHLVQHRQNPRQECLPQTRSQHSTRCRPASPRLRTALSR